MPAAKLLGSPCANTSASPAAATLPILVPYSIHTITLARQVAHPAAAPHSSWLVNAIWRLVETRVVRFAYPAPGAEPTVSNQPMVSFPIPVSSPSNSRSTIPGQLLPLLLTLPSSSRQLQVRMVLIRVRKMSRLRHTAVPSPTIQKDCA